MLNDSWKADVRVDLTSDLRKASETARVSSRELMGCMLVSCSHLSLR